MNAHHVYRVVRSTYRAELRILALTVVLLCIAPRLWSQLPSTWTVTANMGVGRSEFELIKIDAHRVLIMGGWADGDITSLLQVYDARTKQVSQRTPMPVRTSGSASTMLRDGRIIVVGGTHGTGWPDVRVCFYDPDSDTWSLSANMRAARSGHRVIVWDERTVLIVGGGDSGIEFYDIVDREARNSPFALNGANGALIRRADDTLIAFGWRHKDPMDHSVPAWGYADVKYILPTDGPISGRTGTMTAPIYWPSVAQLTNGGLLIAGGVLADFAGVNTISTDIQMFRRNSFENIGNLLEPRARSISVEFANGKVIVVGGMDENSRSLSSCEVIDVATGDVAMGPPMNEPRNGFGLTTLLDAEGRTVVVAVGGRNAQGRSATIEELLITSTTSTGTEGVNSQAGSAPSLVLSPNPASTNVTLRLQHAAVADLPVLILDGQGRVVFTTVIRSGEDSVLLDGVDGLPSGIYAVVVRDATASFTTSLTVLR